MTAYNRMYRPGYRIAKVCLLKEVCSLLYKRMCIWYPFLWHRIFINKEVVFWAVFTSLIYIITYTILKIFEYRFLKTNIDIIALGWQHRHFLLRLQVHIFNSRSISSFLANHWLVSRRPRLVSLPVTIPKIFLDFLD